MSTEAQPLTLCTQENGIRRIVLNNPAKRCRQIFAFFSVPCKVISFKLRYLVQSKNGIYNIKQAVICYNRACII